MDFPRARHRFQPVSSVRGVTATSELRVTFSGVASEHGPGTCALHAPWLAGAEHDALFDGAMFQSEHGAVRLYRQRALSVGCLRVPGELSQRRAPVKPARKTFRMVFHQCPRPLRGRRIVAPRKSSQSK